MANNEDVILGEISGVHGLQGWVKIFSFTRPRMKIFDYDEWVLINPGRMCQKVLQGRVQGKTLVAQLADVTSKEVAHALIGSTIVVPSVSLEELPKDEYYWRQLIGLNVVGLQGHAFGEVTEMLETGANDVMLVSTKADAKNKSSSWAIPWLDEVVKRVDLEKKLIEVDWDESF